MNSFVQHIWPQVMTPSLDDVKNLKNAECNLADVVQALLKTSQWILMSQLKWQNMSHQ